MMDRKVSLPKTKPEPGLVHFAIAFRNAANARVELIGQVTEETAYAALALLMDGEGDAPKPFIEVTEAEPVKTELTRAEIEALIPEPAMYALVKIGLAASEFRNIEPSHDEHAAAYSYSDLMQFARAIIAADRAKRGEK